jgi:two-component system, chemotaxis family, protein-glutamate methylesterase/glutaminase
MARVLIADDSAAFRALARRLVRDHGHEVAGEAADAPAALRLARALAPDAVLLDVHLGAADGHAVARALGALDPRPRVVMVSSDPDAHRGRGPFVAKAELATHPLGALLGPAAAR